MPVRNGLLWEIKKFYAVEYEIGIKSIQLIDDKLSIKLPEDEAGFIAIHILNAEHNNLSDYNQVTEMVQNILSLVKYHFRVSFDEESLTYFRFVTHLKFFAQRVLTKAFFHNEDSALYEIVKEKYPDSYKCVKKIEIFLNKKYGYEMAAEEKLYLMIHIHRIIQKNESVDI